MNCTTVAAVVTVTGFDGQVLSRQCSRCGRTVVPDARYDDESWLHAEPGDVDDAD